MKFTIAQVALWPQDPRNKVVALPFQAGKINIIHGRSGTGKSSIIAIIDYCLGAARCAIPVGVIRDNVEWFGLVVTVRGSHMLIARRTPGQRQTSNDFFLGEFNGDLPTRLSVTHNDLQFKQAFNNLVRLTNLPLSEGTEIGQHEGRPSYRDLAAFNFLPQHIVANPNTLFYKADSYDHKERLKKVMPFALGIIDSEYVAKERQRNQLQRQHDDLIKQRELRRRSMASWDAEVSQLWNEAVELGLAKADAVTTEQRVNRFREVNAAFLKDGLEDVLQAPNYAFTNAKYNEAQTREETLQADADGLRRQVRGFERLAKRAVDLSDAVDLERSRVVNLGWLKAHLGAENECVVCGGSSNQLHEVVAQLEGEVNRVNGFASALFDNPIVDREIEETKNRLNKTMHDLHSARVARLRLQKLEFATKDSLSRVFVLLGRIQALVAAFAIQNNSDDLGERIARLVEELRELDEYFRRSGKAAREASVDSQLSRLIEHYADGFELDRRGTISLDKHELTLSFKQDSQAKKEYLWEVGSGANWMGYHIATFLALHEFLSGPGLETSPVFGFLVIDQPSQVYFPSAASGANALDSDGDSRKKLEIERDVDVGATKKIFEMLEQGMARASFQYQVIVLEHADESIWGHFQSTVPVANWKSEGDGLIPAAWHVRG